MLRRALDRARLGAALVAATVALQAPRAEANGRFPAAQHVWVGPGRSSQSIALRTTFGFALSHDGGQTFHWACEQALGYAGGVFDPPFVLDARSQLYVGLFDGLGALSSDGCSFARDPAFESLFMADLDADRDGTTILAVSSNGSPSAINRVFRSVNGAAFEPLGAGMSGVLFATLEMARSNPQRVYATGLIPTSPSHPAFYRSDDGGVTLTEVPFASVDTVRALYVSGIDPTDPDVVFVRGLLRDRGDAGDTTDPTVLFRSDDGGSTWHEVARSTFSMLGFAISDDGRTVWYGSANAAEGLFRSVDGGMTFSRIGNQQVQCLRQHEGVLYLCANYVTDGFALGRSTDNGETFTSLLQFADLQGPFVCEGDASTNACDSMWGAVHAQFLPQTMDAGSEGVDAAGAEPANPSSTCGCRVPGGSSSGGWGVAFLALSMLLARRSRRVSSAVAARRDALRSRGAPLPL